MSEKAKAFASSIPPKTREYIDAKIEDPLKEAANNIKSNGTYMHKMEAETKERLANMEARIFNMEQILELTPKSRAMLQQLIAHFNEDN